MNWIKTIISKIYRRIFKKDVDVNLSMSKTLFIIGNGFDCYFHNLPTRYLDFKKYLMERFPDYDIDFDGILSPMLMPNGEEKYDDDELVGVIIYYGFNRRFWDISILIFDMFFRGSICC